MIHSYIAAVKQNATDTRSPMYFATANLQTLTLVRVRRPQQQKQ